MTESAGGRVPNRRGAVLLGVAVVAAIVAAFIVAIMASILLVLATVSAAAAMFLSVQARTAEIALRRAIGTARWAVAGLFIAEGAMVGVLGGALGALAGTVGLMAISASQGWSPVLVPWLIPLGIAIGLVTGVLSALLPAREASRTEPVRHL